MSETTKHREAFELFWRLGSERSIERLREALVAKNGRAPSLRTLYAWSAHYGWQTRIARYEREARLAEDEWRIAEVKEMAKRQAQAGIRLQEKGAEWLTLIDGRDVTAEAAIRAITEGAKLERLAREQPTERQELNGDLTTHFGGFSDEELDALIEIAQGLMGGAGETQSG